MLAVMTGEGGKWEFFVNDVIFEQPLTNRPADLGLARELSLFRGFLR